MPRSHLDQIWSQYTTLPDPLSGMDSLYQMCSMFTKHFLEPSHIILASGGFTLHSDLARPLADVVPTMDYLLSLAAQFHGLSSTPFIGTSELIILTTTATLRAPATQNQIVLAWVTLIPRIEAAMRELKALCIGDPFNPSRHMLPSRIPEAIMMLPRSLCVKLPKDFMDSFDMPFLSSRCTRKVNVAPRRSKADVRMDSNTAARARFPPGYGAPSVAAELESVEACVEHAQASALADPQRALKLGLAVEEQSQGSWYPSAESMCLRTEHLLTPSVPSRKDHSLRSTTTTLACADHRSSRPSVKELAAAIEATERTLGKRKHPGNTSIAVAAGTRSVLKEADPRNTLIAESKCPEAWDAPASTPSDAPREPELEAGVAATGQPNASVVENCMGPEDSASFQLSAPADLVAKTAVVELGGLDEDRHILAESAISSRDTTLTAEVLLKNKAASTSTSTFHAPRVVRNVSHMPGIRSKSRLRGHALQVVDALPSLKSPAPALVIDQSMVELGGLKAKTDQECPILPVGVRTVDERTSARRSPPSIHLSRARAQLSSPSSHQSPHPALVDELDTKLGGLDDSYQPCADGCNENVLALEMDSWQEDCASALPAPALAMEGNAVELGGLTSDLPAEYSQDWDSAKLLTRVSRSRDRSSGCAAPENRAARNSTAPGFVSPPNFPAPALVTDESMVELGGALSSSSTEDQQPATLCTESTRTGTCAHHIHSCFIPPVSHSTSVIFALVSAIIRTLWISYLGHSVGENCAPWIVWEREGIGTPRWI
ncbi:hypothetical protein FB451DRAFT_1387088 [Mycena latifolia]|nr:hypothetical protein FB451DRAFT_1387088 [Mycena latifolia]